jgi:hypothetical protein
MATTYDGGGAQGRSTKLTNRAVFLRPAVADLNAPTVAEFAAATAYKIDCAIPDIEVSASTNTETNQPLCTAVAEEFPLGTTYSIGDLTVWEAKRGPDGDFVEDPLWESVLANGASTVLAIRDFMPTDTAVAAGQWFDVIAVRVNSSVPSGTDAIQGRVYSMTVAGYAGHPVQVVAGS